MFFIYATEKQSVKFNIFAFLLKTVFGGPKKIDLWLCTCSCGVISPRLYIMYTKLALMPLFLLLVQVLKIQLLSALKSVCYIFTFLEQPQNMN